MLKKLFEHTATVIITVLVTGIVGAWFFGTSDLEYREGIKESYFNIPDKAPSDLVIKHKGKQIDNISVYDFVIENNSYKDLKEVELFFELTSKSDSALPSLISQGLYATKSYASNLGITTLPKPADNIYVYKIDLFQRDSEVQYIARFIFEGEVTPNIRVSTPKNMDVRIVEYSYKSETLLGILIAGGVLGFIVVFAFLADGIGSEKRWYKRKQDIAKSLEPCLSDIADKQKIINAFFEKYDEDCKPRFHTYNALRRLVTRTFRLKS